MILFLSNADTELLAQRVACYQFHHQELLSVTFADVVNGADVRMIQRRSGTCLTAEALQKLRVAGVRGRQELHRNLAAQPRILGIENNSRAPAADFFKYSIVRNRFANHDWQRC